MRGEPLAVIGSLVLLACGAGDDSAARQGAGGAGATAAACSGKIVASADHDYQLSTQLTASMSRVMPSAQLVFDWSNLAVDLLNQPVDLGTVDMLEVVLWNLSVEDFESKLDDGTLDTHDAEHVAWVDTTPYHQTATSTFQMRDSGGPFTQDASLGYFDLGSYPPSTHLYTALVANGKDLGRGTRMLQGFELDPASTNTEVDIDSSSTKLAFTATIAERPVTSMPAGTPNVTIDWSKLTLTAAGGACVPQQISHVRIGAYTQTPTELEGADLLALDELATDMYSADVEAGTSIDFDTTLTKDGKAFAGIDDTHTWIVALDCGTCQNPMPWYLSVLKPCVTSK